MNEANTDRYYRTSSFYVAAFLFAKGFELANIDKAAHTKRANFVFVNRPELEELVHDFNFAKEDALSVMVDTRKLVTSIKTLKDKLYQDEF